MKSTVGFYDFERAFVDMGRTESFGYQAKRAIFNYIESIEDSTGEEIELDVVSICGDFNEYESIEEFKKEYGEDYESIYDIRDITTVLELDDGGFVVEAF